MDTIGNYKQNFFFYFLLRRSPITFPKLQIQGFLYPVPLKTCKFPFGKILYSVPVKISSKG